MDVFDSLLLMDGFCFTCLQGQFFCQPEGCLPISFRHFADDFSLSRLRAVVFYFCFDKDAVAGLIVPYVNAEWFHTYLRCFLQGDRTEDAKWLTAFGKAPFR